MQNGPGKSPLSLPDAEIKRRLDAEILAREEKIKAEVGAENWDRLSPGQKTAVLDVHYANGSLKDFPSLKEGIETGNAEEIGKNVDFHSDGSRNWDRLARNRAEAQGISLDEAKRQVEADRPAGKFDLPAKPDQVDLSTLRPEPRPQDGAGQTPSSEQQDSAPLQEAPKPAPEPQAQPAPQPAPEPAPQPVSPPEQKKSETPADPKVAAMVEMAGKPVDNPGRSALLKPVDRLTQPEMMDMIASAQGDYRGWRSGDPLKAHTYEKVQDWHVAMYGDQPQGNDGGKPIEPQPIRPIPHRPVPHTTPDGEDLWQATGRLGGLVAEAAAQDGTAEAVTGLQRGLNMLGDAHPLPERSPAYGPYTKLAPIAEDGAYGPQTDFALKHATARLGPDKVEEGLALGRFNTFARATQAGGSAEGLADKTHAIFGPLLRDPGDTASSTAEAGALQRTLNGFGAELKPDNWIGPKTTEAFADVLKAEDADAVTKAFGKRLGFL
ncbi:MAG: hypothetical protein ACM31L_08435 [Actinomycetota bacterium]